jgi:hypothetical protein
MNIKTDPPSVLWLSLPDKPEVKDAPLIEALQDGDAWTEDTHQAARLAEKGYTVKRRDRHIDGRIIETTLNAHALNDALGRGVEMRGEQGLNRPTKKLRE